MLRLPALALSRRPTFHGRAAFVALGVIVAAAVLLRVTALTSQNFWYDEIYSFDVSRLPLGQIIASAEGDMHPPLFYMLLKAWHALFGTSDAALRALSVCASAAALILTFFIGRRMGDFVALTATAALAISAHQTYYAQETRMYALVTALMLGAALAYRRWLESDGERRRMLTLYALLSAAAMYTHYFAMLIVAALNVHWLLHTLGLGRRGAPNLRRLVIAWTLAQTLIGVLYLPWIGVFLTQAKRGQPWRTPTPVVEAVQNGAAFIGVAVFGYGTDLDAVNAPTANAARSPEQTARLQVQWLARLVAFFLLAVGLGWGAVGLLRGEEREYFHAVLFLVPLVIAIGVSLRQSIDLSRYLLIITPHLFCLTATGFARLLRSQRQFAAARGARRLPGSAVGTAALFGFAAVLGAGMTLGLRDHYAAPSRDSDLRPVLADIQARIRPGDRIIIDPDYNDSCLLFYGKRYGLERALTPAEHQPPAGQGQIAYFKAHPEIVRWWVILDYHSNFFDQPTIDPTVSVKSVRAYGDRHPRLRLLEIERPTPLP
jgi:uncharacterized membrane protein